MTRVEWQEGCEKEEVENEACEEELEEERRGGDRPGRLGGGEGAGV